jgi:PAS domain S-box-containing protein
MGKTPRVLKSGQHDQEFYHDFWQTILSGKTWRGEFTNRRKDGSIYYDEHTVTPVRSPAGKITHFIGIMNDVTARKRAEDTLRESEDRYRSLVEESPDVIGIYQDGKLIFVNSTGARLFGAGTKEELLGRRSEQMIHPDDLHDAMDRVRRRLEGETGMYPAEVRYLRRDGKALPVEVSAAPITFGGKPAVQFTARDITARKLADARLHDSEALYHSLVEHVPQHVFRKDLAGRFTFGNGPFCRSLGKPLAEILGKTDLDFCPAELAAKYQRDDQWVIQTGQPFEGEEEHRRADGEMIFVNVIKTPLRDAAGKIIGVQGISWDITERRQLEEQFRRAQKMEAIGQLSAGVAHDFNNMLAVIHGNAEMALMFANHSGDDARECINQVIAASERAAGLTRQLLAFGRKQVLQSQPLDLNEVIGNLTRMLNRIIGENINLQCACATGLPVVQADVGMMEQVLLNLVVNARDAMPQGGQLLIKTEQTNLDEAYADLHPEARAGEFICMSVGDTGTGIAPGHLARIFEPFYTTKEIGKGTGLGLATVYGIVKQHEGWVEVATQPGAGTTFSVFLPAIPLAATEAAVPPAPALRGGTETILLVEDDSAVRLVTRRILEAFDYHVVETATGREALASWRTRAGEIDLLLTDIVMPDGVTGRELAEALLMERPATKIIFMSGYSKETAGRDTDFIQRTKSYFLQKPFSSRVLIQTVQQCLDE